LPVPSILSLGDHYEQTAQFLGALRTELAESWKLNRSLANYGSARRMGSRVQPIVQNYRDFTTLQQVTPAVALVLASEYDRVTRAGGYVPRAVDLHRWNPEVKALLDGLGFFELLGVDRRRANLIEGEGWRMLRFRSGNAADGYIVHELLEELRVPDFLDDPELYGAIVEALVNTRQHAYPAEHIFPEPHIPNWWLTGFIDERAKRVRISVFDQGLSIPGTLNTWSRYPAYLQRFKKLFRSEPDPSDRSRDGTSIALAMAVGKSSTGWQYRGRGLPIMEAVVDLCRSGTLTIYSRSGQYMRKTGARSAYLNRTAEIGGTLIIWDLSS
jgi:hypothetical protein